jgi:hypothetical protein
LGYPNQEIVRRIQTMGKKIRDQFGLEEAKVVDFNRFIEREWKIQTWQFSDNLDKPILIYVIQVSS